MPLTIYRSSAGSGKTFTLVKEYLKLVLKRPKDFQHILAITFTNKATEEMKSRVLHQLRDMAEGNESAMQAALLAELGDLLDEDALRQRAGEVYELIIHRYSRFEISTIDSFFSRVVRSFARELDIPMSYELEMNTDLALDEAIEQLFRSISADSELRHWLEQYAFDQIEDDRSWNVETNIRDLGSNLFKEQFQAGFARVNISMERLTELVAEMKKVIRLYEEGMKARGRKAVSLIEKHQLSLEDFHYGKSGPANTFYKIAKGDFVQGSRFLQAAAGDLAWARKNSPNRAVVEQLVESKLLPIAVEILNHVKKYERNYRTSKALFRNIYSFGLLETLNRNLKTYRDEQNIMLISDNNALIREIVKEDDAPFIFEKLGSFFRHILIDEFQDTSNFQWNNLKPLILNSLASGHEVLIVGDVKQSIYRFRGGNMRLLLEQVEQDLVAFKEEITTKNLEDNYRSQPGVVRFNNAFFDELINQMSHIEHVHDPELIKRTYKSHQQVPKREGDGGGVRVMLFKPQPDEPSDWRDQALDELVLEIRKNAETGCDWRDIMILVSRNKEMTLIAERLLAENIPFVSESSLLLAKNPLVRFLVEALRYLQSESDPIGRMSMVHWFRQLKGIADQAHLMKDSREPEELKALGMPADFIDRRRDLAQLPLFDLVEQLLLIFDLRAHSDVFIQRFQDLLLEQNARGIHSIYGFLEWWDKQGQEETIAGNENTNAISIMSVHKSKGLESPLVMMPFADYSFLPNARLHTFWTAELPENLQDLAFVPLNYHKNSLLDTDFHPAFEEETLESVVDSLNKTYVAFTRAREKLWVAGPLKPPSKESGLSTLNHFLESVLPGLEGLSMNETHHALLYDYNFTDKKPDRMAPAEPVVASELLDAYPRADYIRHLSIRPDSDRFMSQDKEKVSRYVCEVLSSLPLWGLPLWGLPPWGEAHPLGQQLVAEGLIPLKEKEAVVERVEQLMKNKQVRDWFGTGYEVMTERELFYEGKLLKPDRVMQNESETVVVNFHPERLPLEKKEEERHKQRLKRHLAALSEIPLGKGPGYENLKGFLVYVESPVQIREVRP